LENKFFNPNNEFKFNINPNNTIKTKDSKYIIIPKDLLKHKVILIINTPSPPTLRMSYTSPNSSSHTKASSANSIYSYIKTNTNSGSRP
jgi:hypothetical protein